MSKHAKISYVKSGMRIIGFVLLPWNMILGTFVLIIAELTGIVEEFYE